MNRGFCNLRPLVFLLVYSSVLASAYFPIPFSVLHFIISGSHTPLFKLRKVFNSGGIKRKKNPNRKLDHLSTLYSLLRMTTSPTITVVLKNVFKNSLLKGCRLLAVYKPRTKTRFCHLEDSNLADTFFKSIIKLVSTLT